MTIASLGAPQIALTLGNARAVLQRVSGAHLVQRDAIASYMLQYATGRGDVVVSRRPSGRPRLAAPHPELGVSMSCRHDLLLVGFSPVGHVGVDIELTTSATPIDPALLARDHFSGREACRIASLPRAEALDLFLRLWAAKEAILKLTGRGIVDGLRQPDLSDFMDWFPEGRKVPVGSGPIALKFGPFRNCRVVVRCVVISEALGIAYCALACTEA